VNLELEYLDGDRAWRCGATSRPADERKNLSSSLHATYFIQQDRHST